MQEYRNLKAKLNWFLIPPKGSWYWFTVCYAATVEICIAILLKDIGLSPYIWGSSALAFAALAMIVMTRLKDQ